MKNNLLDIYSKTKKSFKEPKKIDNKISISFFNGPRVSIDGQLEKEYVVKFIDKKTKKIVYKSNIKNNMWAKSTIAYFVDWRVEVECENQLVYEEELNIKDKNVLVIIDSKSIGDILAYTPQIDLFQIKHGCKMDVMLTHKELVDILNSSYQNINFVMEEKADKYYAVYRIGYPLEDWVNIIPVDPKTITLQKVASYILGLEHKESKPILTFSNTVKSYKKYVCIATQSTAQCKYWNNEKGWEEVVKNLNDSGYDVWCIDRYASYGNSKHKMNYIPKGAIDKTGDFPLELRMSQIHNAEFFIGLGSGLSWLAWALNKPVVLISGFSKPWAEFETPYRVFNEDVCNGCWNDTSLKFDKADWMWCPRNKNFECSKEITSDMVIEKINLLIKKKTKVEDIASIILCHPNSPKKVQVLKKCIDLCPGVKIVSSNYQLDDEVQKLADYCLVSNKNETLKKTEFEQYSLNYYLTSNTEFGLVTTQFEFEHGYAVYSLIRNGLKLAKGLGFKKVHVINYDYFINEDTFNNHLSLLNENDCVFYDYQKKYYDRDSFCTGFFSGKTSALLEFFDFFKTKHDYYSHKVNPLNILEIKSFEFLDKSNLKIAKIRHDYLAEMGNKTDFIGVNYKDSDINIQP